MHLLQDRSDILNSYLKNYNKQKAGRRSLLLKPTRFLMLHFHQKVIRQTKVTQPIELNEAPNTVRKSFATS